MATAVAKWVSLVEIFNLEPSLFNNNNEIDIDVLLTHYYVRELFVDKRGLLNSLRAMNNHQTDYFYDSLRGYVVRIIDNVDEEMVENFDVNVTRPPTVDVNTTLADIMDNMHLTNKHKYY